MINYDKLTCARRCGVCVFPKTDALTCARISQSKSILHQPLLHRFPLPAARVQFFHQRQQLGQGQSRQSSRALSHCDPCLLSEPLSRSLSARFSSFLPLPRHQAVNLIVRHTIWYDDPQRYTIIR